MKCPVCDLHTTTFANLLQSERRLYAMPFIRTCPWCGTKLRFGAIPSACLFAFYLFLHASFEAGVHIARRYGLDRDDAVICTGLVLVIPIWVLLYFF